VEHQRPVPDSVGANVKKPSQAPNLLSNIRLGLKSQ
jgi:hypothetical protein